MRTSAVRPSALLPMLVMILLPAFSAAQKSSSPALSNETQLKPIEVEDHTLGGLQYSVDGRLLVRYQDFEQLLAPLRDYETQRLLKRSEAADGDSKIFGLVGLAGLATGVVGLLTSPSSQKGPFWVTAIGGAVAFDVGGLFQTEAQTAKFNCVQRYNRFARGEEQILPQGPSDEKSLLNFGTATPTPSSANP